MSKLPPAPSTDPTAQSDCYHYWRGFVVEHNVSLDTTSGGLGPPEVRSTKAVAVRDLLAGAVHLILVHELDYRAGRVHDVGEVVVFSKPCYAPFRATNLQLATSAYYREREGLEEYIRDPQDGILTKDATPWARAIAGPSARAEMSFGSTSEPWVYCGSHYCGNGELHELKNYFREKAVTAIPDPNGFARWLGIEFALNLDKMDDIRLRAREIIADAFCRDIDTVVHVHHGPVHYEDKSGRIAISEDLRDPHGGLRATFTKKKSFKFQSEYRFAVSTHGDPVETTHYITISPELREFCHELLR
ncbi:MAG: hypothetical protein OXG35_26630 [Acidobacteria bacterium]|nr:hypothetical protein [Acidobacteriota bacterium]